MAPQAQPMKQVRRGLRAQYEVDPLGSPDLRLILRLPPLNRAPPAPELYALYLSLLRQAVLVPAAPEGRVRLAHGLDAGARARLTARPRTRLLRGGRVRLARARLLDTWQENPAAGKTRGSS